MKKKILAICLCVAMLSIAIIGGSLAYFTDTDYKEYVMTTGKVDIIQLNQQRDANGGLVDYVADQPLMPMVDSRATGEAVLVDGYFNPAMKNVVDKLVSVKNAATAGAKNQDVYARTILAFETTTTYNNDQTVAKNGKAIFDEYIKTNGSFTILNRDTITIKGVEYVLAVKVYSAPIEPGETSEYALKQIYLSSDADNEVATLFGDTYTVLALSQATQTAGFDSAEEALNKAFGDLETIDANKLIEWFTTAVPNP